MLYVYQSFLSVLDFTFNIVLFLSYCAFWYPHYSLTNRCTICQFCN